MEYTDFYGFTPAIFLVPDKTHCQNMSIVSAWCISKLIPIIRFSHP